MEKITQKELSKKTLVIEGIEKFNEMSVEDKVKFLISNKLRLIDEDTPDLISISFWNNTAWMYSPYTDIQNEILGLEYIGEGCFRITYDDKDCYERMEMEVRAFLCLEFI